MFWTVLHNELQISLTNKNNFLAPVCFFLIIFAIFPLIISDLNQLAALFPAIVIICSLFMVMLSSEQIFAIDINDGYIEQSLTVGIPPRILFFSKVVSSFVILIIPILLSIFLTGLAYNIDYFFLGIIAISIIVILPLFITNSLFVSLLTYGSTRTSLIASLITIPLNIPALIMLALSLQNQTSLNFSCMQMLIGLELVFIPLVIFLSGILIKNIANNLDSL